MKLYLWKPGHNPYNFTNVSIKDTQLVEFTDEYMMGKIINDGHWRNTGNIVIKNTVPIPFGKLFAKCNGKIYIEVETSGIVSRKSWSYISINDKKVSNTELSREVYTYNMPQQDSVIQFCCGHNKDSGACFKCYGIYIEINATKAIKKAVLEKILKEKLIEKHLINMVIEKQGEWNDRI